MIIPPGSTIGIIGGGQLGRMAAQAAAALGYKTHIYCPDADCPAFQVSSAKTQAAYENAKALEQFARAVDVITFEFENIPHESLQILEKHTRVHPSAEVLRISRNRLREKTFINELGIGTAPFKRITSLEELKKSFTGASILKTTELGYDGKGQAKILNASECESAWKTLANNELILEGFVDFRMEISVIVARGADGISVAYDPVENVHRNHILHTTTAPARISKALADNAQAIAVRIAEGLKLIGVLAVEMFVTRDDKIPVNELAPRPHNSGHWTIDACVTSQFEQQIRAVCGLPLGSTKRLCDAVMTNLIGDEINDWKKYASDPFTKLHLYGKSVSRPGRKMGHVTVLKG